MAYDADVPMSRHACGVLGKTAQNLLRLRQIFVCEERAQEESSGKYMQRLQFLLPESPGVGVQDSIRASNNLSCTYIVFTIVRKVAAGQPL
jgi:hypothetical protein